MNTKPKLSKQQKAFTNFQASQQSVLACFSNSKFNSTAFKEIGDYMKNIIQYSTLSKPLEEFTNDFVNDFLPDVIQKVLAIRVKNENHFDSLSVFLKKCSILYGTVIDNPAFEPYIVKSVILYSEINSQFYSNSFYFYQGFSHLIFNYLRKSDKDKNPPLNLPPLLRLKEYLENNDVSKEALIAFLSIFRSWGQELKDSQFKLTMYKLLSTKIRVSISNLEDKQLRDFNEKSIFDSLSKVVSQFLPQDTTDNIIETYLSLTKKLVFSSYLDKQLSALDAISKLFNMQSKNPTKICNKIYELQIIDHLLQSSQTLHDSLVDKFTNIFSHILRNHGGCNQTLQNRYGYNFYSGYNHFNQSFNQMNPEELIQLQQEDFKHLTSFWRIALDQPPATAEHFFTVFQNFESQLSNDYDLKLGQIILSSISPEISDSVLKFISQASFSSLLNDNKCCFNLFNSLSDYYFQTHNKNALPAICRFIPTDSNQSKIQETKCFEFIRNHENLDYALTILKKILKNISPQQAQAHFHEIIFSITKNASDYFELLEKILNAMHHTTLSDEYLNQLINITKDEPHAFSFYSKLFSYSNSRLIPPHKFPIFLDLVCESKSFGKEEFDFLNKCLDIINYNNITISLKNVWNLLFRTQNPDLLNMLMNRYRTRPSEFINCCMSNASLPGALNSLYMFICENEDASPPSEIRINKYVCEQDQIHITLDGSFSTEMVFPSDISFKAFSQRAALIIKSDPSNLIFTKRGEVVESMDQIQNGCTIEVSLKENQFGMYKGQNGERPTKIIACTNAPEILLSILSSNNPDLQLMSTAFNILNRLPTVYSETRILNESQEWNEILDPENPYLMLYRLNAIGNKISNDESEWIQLFFATGGPIRLLTILLNPEKIHFVKEQDFITPFRILSNILSHNYWEECQLNIEDISATSLVNFIEKTENENLIILGLDILVKANLIDSPELPNLINKLIFTSSWSIGSSTRLLLIRYPPGKLFTILVHLLPNSRNQNCYHYFKSFEYLVENSSDDILTETWNLLSDALIQEFQEETEETINQPNENNSSDNLPESPEINPSENSSTLTKESDTTIPPENQDQEGAVEEKHTVVFRKKFIQSDYVNHILSVLNLIMKKTNRKYPNEDAIFNLLLSSILFNEITYVKKDPVLFQLISKLIMNEKDERVTITMRKFQRFREQYTDDVKTAIPIDASRRYRGIKNLGCTCYMNSTLQQLYHIPELRSGILCKHFKNTPDQELQPWIIPLQDVFSQLAYSPANYIDLTPFVSNWTIYGEHVDPHEQKDAQEFMSSFLDNLQSILPEVTQLLQGKQVNTMQHNGCVIGQPSVEPFTCLPLEVKGIENIEDSFKNFLSGETISGYQMEDGNKVDVQRTSRISEAPKILAIQLKRFSFSVETMQRIKINSKFEFPFHLNIASLLSHSVDTLIYDLTGIILHQGDASGGHYFSYILCNDNKWREFNDTGVSELDPKNMMDIAKGGNRESKLYGHVIQESNTSAYILFYRQHNNEDDSTSTDDLTLDNETMILDTDVAERTKDFLRKMLIQDAMNKHELVSLIQELLPLINDKDFIYSCFISNLKANAVHMASPYLIKCCPFCSDPQFASQILSEKQYIKQFLIDQTIEEYKTLIVTAINNAPPEVIKQFSEDFIEAIKDNELIIAKRWKDLGNIFSILTNQKIIPDQATWEPVLMKFITETMPNYIETNQQVFINDSINFSSIFDILCKIPNLSLFSRTFDVSQSETSIQPLLKNINSWMLSPYHFNSLCRLLDLLIQNCGDKNQAKNKARFLKLFEENKLIHIDTFPSFYLFFLSYGFPMHIPNEYMKSVGDRFQESIFRSLEVRIDIRIIQIILNNFYEISKFMFFEAPYNFQGHFTKMIKNVLGKLKSLPQDKKNALCLNALVSLVKLIPKLPVFQISPLENPDKIVHSSSVEDFIPNKFFETATGIFDKCTKYFSENQEFCVTAGSATIKFMKNCDRFEEYAYCFLYRLDNNPSIFFKHNSFKDFLTAIRLLKISTSTFNDSFQSLINLLPKDETNMKIFFSSVIFKRFCLHLLTNEEKSKPLISLIKNYSTKTQIIEPVCKNVFEPDFLKKVLKRAYYNIYKLYFFIFRNFPSFAESYFNLIADTLFNESMIPPTFQSHPLENSKLLAELIRAYMISLSGGKPLTPAIRKKIIKKIENYSQISSQHIISQLRTSSMYNSIKPKASGGMFELLTVLAIINPQDFEVSRGYLERYNAPFVSSFNPAIAPAAAKFAATIDPERIINEFDSITDPYNFPAKVYTNLLAGLNVKDPQQLILGEDRIESLFNKFPSIELFHTNVINSLMHFNHFKDDSKEMIIVEAARKLLEEILSGQEIFEDETFSVYRNVLRYLIFARDNGATVNPVPVQPDDLKRFLDNDSVARTEPILNQFIETLALTSND